ncbi:hypothetical protein AX14_004918 [Amanita brunnescens Koide BX004]|nr:hypothetical protein AX14_004918 [Amanita brunnescens Koide BX004]
MARILEPLRNAGINGIIMKDGNGIQCRVHPILAIFIGDYPEQVLVMGTKTGECPKCNIVPEKLGSIDAPYSLWNLQQTCGVLCLVDMDAATFRMACKTARIKPIYHPFWEQLPYVNIYQAMSPDILHQLHQGVFKHLLSWMTKAYGAVELDARSWQQLPNHHIRIFTNGITGLSHVTGKEHDLMCRMLLGLIVGARLQNYMNPSHLVRAVHVFLDFLYLAQLPRQSSQTLHRLNNALETFHENKTIFVDLSIHKNFKIPKVHSLQHYVSSMKLFPTTDNYNTQHTERLHSTLTKSGYHASNARDELPQMTMWLEHWEKLNQKHKDISQVQQARGNDTWHYA